MPTINQLVRKPRSVAKKKSKSPALSIDLPTAAGGVFAGENSDAEKTKLCVA